MIMGIARDFINMTIENEFIERYIEKKDYSKALKHIESLLPYCGHHILFLQLYMGEILYLQDFKYEANNLWESSLIKVEENMVDQEYWHALYRLYLLVGNGDLEEKKVSKTLLQDIRDILCIRNIL